MPRTKVSFNLPSVRNWRSMVPARSQRETLPMLQPCWTALPSCKVQVLASVRKAISISSSYPKIQQICINHRQLCRIQYLISINKLCHNFLNTISLRSLSTNAIILQTRFKVPHPIHVSQKLRYKLNHLIISSKCHHFTSKILPANRAITTKGVN